MVVGRRVRERGGEEGTDTQKGREAKNGKGRGRNYSRNIVSSATSLNFKNYFKREMKGAGGRHMWVLEVKNVNLGGPSTECGEPTSLKV